MSTALTTYLTCSDHGPVPGVFADDVRFSSPFAEYRGREVIAGLFESIPSVFSEVAAVRALHGDHQTATFLHGRIGDHAADAVLDERAGADGLIVDVTLYLRPLAAVKEAVRRMGALRQGVEA